MPFWVRLLLLGMGLLFLGLGIGVGVFGSRGAQAEIARVEALTAIDAAELERRAPGDEVIVEGLVSGRNRALFREFVAYTVQEYRGTDEDGDQEWVDDGRETPRLLLEAGGLIQVGNQDYTLAGDLARWQDSQTLAASTMFSDGTKRYSGLTAELPVLALGTVEQGTEGKQLQARTLFAGTRAEYLQSQRDATTAALIIGAIFGFLGTLLCAVVLWELFRR